MKKTALIFLITMVSYFSFSQDTFSICAIDTLTGEIGSAGASCVHFPTQGIMILSDVHPGEGVIHTQAAYENVNQAYARNLMSQGLSPQQIIDSLIANDAFNNPTIRQYGIVDFRDNVVRTAAYTGVNCLNYKNHITGPNYSIQGNILLGQEILDSMEARFLNSEGELACRLMAALQGANVPGADKRCLGLGISSIGAFLRVAKPDDPLHDFYIQYNLPKVDNGVDPLDSLQVLIDQWGGCNTTGLYESGLEKMLKIYPNPANDIVHFQIDESYTLEQTKLIIYNSSGQKVAELQFGNTREIGWNTRNSISGLHSFQLITREKSIYKGKFVVN